MSRTELRRQAKLAEQAQRWDDMMAFMTKLSNNLEPSEELSAEERNMLGVSYKHVISQKRSSWRVIDSIERSVAGSERELQLTSDFKANVEREIEELCSQLVVRIFTTTAFRAVAGPEHGCETLANTRLGGNTLSTHF